MENRKFASQLLRNLHELAKIREQTAPVDKKCVVTISPAPVGVQPFLLYQGNMEEVGFDGDQTPTNIIDNTFVVGIGFYSIVLTEVNNFVDFSAVVEVNAEDVANGTKSVAVTLEAK